MDVVCQSNSSHVEVGSTFKPLLDGVVVSIYKDCRTAIIIIIIHRLVGARFIAAGVETSARPSTYILNSANNRSAINGVEAVSWVNAVLFLLNAILCFCVYWSAETGFWIPTVEDYRHAVAMEESNEKLAEQRKLDHQDQSDEWNSHGKTEEHV